MKKRNNKHEKRVKRMIVACGLCAIILSMSTYAWFIGMKTVSVSSFDVKIAAIDSLQLSLTGGKDNDWADTVIINKDNFDTVNPAGKNTWTKNGLIPMSSVGVVNKTSSRLELYEKGSLTATQGGYRLLASKVKNEDATQPEADGYVAFDLFIKNMSGKEYYTNDLQLNEEAIYLTPESSVTVKKTADKDEKTGIENSVRIAFAQIGRVKATQTDNDLITGITCAGNEATDDTKITGICRQAQIWEPNNTKHVQNAIKWYETACKARKTVADLKDLNQDGVYEGACGKVEDGKSAPTYAINDVIGVEDFVDVYDGEKYNTYTGSTKLTEFKYFTDEDKDKKGTERPELITLAPNSITKVRVYIWLEGQDIDNYDFASLGKTISVAFGFTKEQLYGEDIEYTPGPTLPAEVDKRPEATPSTAEPTPTPDTP